MRLEVGCPLADSQGIAGSLVANAVELEQPEHKALTEPDGNIYRGWAIGIHKSSRVFLLTVVVILVQVGAPLAAFHSTVPKLIEGHFAYMTPSLSVDVWFHKLVGVFFLILVYINGDSILKRQDVQADRLRCLYQENLSKTWMLLDAFCNSWCITLCAMAAPGLLWTADDTKDMLLDALGLIFLHRLDDYSGEVDYWFRTEDFNSHIENRAKNLLGDATSSALLTQMWRRSWRDCFHFGDIFYSIARLVNEMSFCVTVPAFAMLTYSHEPATKPAGEELYDKPPEVFVIVWLVAAAGFTCRLSSRAYAYFSRPADPANLRDCLAVCAKVVFGRHDPRFPPDPRELA